MSGHFSSKAQSERDSAFFDISLVMYPIWKNSTEAKWMYVEQAASAYKDQPYRQRVYRISMVEAGLMESRVYELDDPSKYIHAWEKPALFEALTSDSLILREGCSVFLKASENCFSGSTREKECLSSLRGASYASSIVEICPNKITSWDQGWNSDDEQVWGAVSGPYVFDRLDQ
ncbi:chromophore lyase CpcT/CpeT [Moorena sp. SIO4A1]|uniref:chromophore lyase CpcT/CpeT n=1 Tax=Moorena sp. SIO4A1 TaxID=2607835 RepID=UPI0025F50447|nr:chromophore lyase CpcT/CpeT [Moorena sp. SIO4A1]